MRKRRTKKPEPRVPLSRSEIEDRRVDIRLMLYKQGATQLYANRFKSLEMSPQGIMVCYQYDLCRFVIRKSILHTKRSGKVITKAYACAWYSDVHIHSHKNGTKKLVGLTAA